MGWGYKRASAPVLALLCVCDFRGKALTSYLAIIMRTCYTVFLIFFIIITAVNTLLLYIIIAAINWRSRYLSTSSIHRGFQCSNIHRHSAAYTHYPEVVPSLALARDNLG